MRRPQRIVDRPQFLLDRPCLGAGRRQNGVERPCLEVGRCCCRETRPRGHTKTRTMDAGEAYFLPLPCQYFLYGFSFLFFFPLMFVSSFFLPCPDKDWSDVRFSFPRSWVMGVLTFRFCAVCSGNGHHDSPLFPVFLPLFIIDW